MQVVNISRVNFRGNFKPDTTINIVAVDSITKDTQLKEAAALCAALWNVPCGTMGLALAEYLERILAIEGPANTDATTYAAVEHLISRLRTVGI